MEKYHFCACHVFLNVIMDCAVLATNWKSSIKEWKNEK
jgi:hypothetical protein